MEDHLLLVNLGSRGERLPLYLPQRQPFPSVSMAELQSVPSTHYTVTWSPTPHSLWNLETS